MASQANAEVTSYEDSIEYRGPRPLGDTSNPCRARLADLVQNRGRFHEIAPEKLYLIHLAKDVDQDLFCYDAGKRDNSFIFWTVNDSPNLEYIPFDFDFGPLNLAMTHEFVSRIKIWLDTQMYRDPDKHIAVVIDDCKKSSTKRKLNLTLLVAIAGMALLNLTDQEVIERLNFSITHKDRQMLTFRDQKKFRDVSGIETTMQITLEVCIKSFYTAMQHKFYNFYEFDHGEYLFYEGVLSGDLNWIIPGKIIAFAGPCDFSTDDSSLKHPPAFYYHYFKDHNVTTIVRLNEPEYKSSGFVDYGFDHVDLIFPDGCPPTVSIANRFIRIVDEAKGAVAVHCYAGMGRTGTLIAAYLMARYSFTAETATAWTRICRPGSIIGPQQDWLLTNSMKYKNFEYSPRNKRPAIMPDQIETSESKHPTKASSSKDLPVSTSAYAIAERKHGQAKALMMVKKQRAAADRPCTRSSGSQKSLDDSDTARNAQIRIKDVILNLGKTVPLMMSQNDVKDLETGQNPETYTFKDGLYEWKIKFPVPDYVYMVHDKWRDIDMEPNSTDEFDYPCQTLMLDFRFEKESIKSPDRKRNGMKPPPRWKPVVSYSLGGGRKAQFEGEFGELLDKAADDTAYQSMT